MSFQKAPTGGGGVARMPSSKAGSSYSSQSFNEVPLLHRYACTLTNIGGKLLQRGSCLPAMKVFQESVQMMMLAEDEKKGEILKYPVESKCLRMEKFLQRLRLDKSIISLPPEMDEDEIHDVNCECRKRPASFDDDDRKPSAKKHAAPETSTTSAGESTCEDDEAAKPKAVPCSHHHILESSPPSAVCVCQGESGCNIVRGIPGLFQSIKKLCGPNRSLDSTLEMPPLCCPDPFFINLSWNKDQPKKSSIKLRIRADQCSEGTLFNMGIIHYCWGSVDTAVKFFELSMSLAPPLAQQGSIPLNPVILACLNNLGQILALRGRVQEGRCLVADALTRGSAWLAQFYHQSGRAQELPTAMQSAKERGLLRYLAGTLMNMGEIQFCICDFEGAMTSCKDAQKLLHPDIEAIDGASLFYNIGLISQHQRKLPEALENYEQFLRIAKGIVGPNHAQIATALHNIGLIHYECGRLQDALRPLVRSLSIRIRRFTGNHLFVAESSHLLGKVLHAREQLGDALHLYRRALSIHESIAESKKEPVDANLELAQVRMDVGRILHLQGSFGESLVSYQQVLDMSRKVFGIKHTYVARLLNIVGNLYLELGRLEDAMSSFTEAMRIQVSNEMVLDSMMSVVEYPLYRVKLELHPHAASG